MDPGDSKPSKCPLAGHEGARARTLLVFVRMNSFKYLNLT